MHRYIVNQEVPMNTNPPTAKETAMDGARPTAIARGLAASLLDVYTVPVHQPLVKTPVFVVREIAAFWAYYLKPVFSPQPRHIFAQRPTPTPTPHDKTGNFPPASPRLPI